MHKLFKKSLSILLVMILSFSLTACSSKKATDTDAGESSDEPVEISFYSWWADAEQEMGNALIESFEKENPNIKVNATYISEADYLSKLNALVAADSMPDVYYLNEFLVNEWGNAGVSADLVPLFDKIGVDYNKTWIDTALYKSNNSIYGINYGSTSIVLYYNKEMLKNAGIEAPGKDASKPWTWDQYVDAAVAMTKDMKGKGPLDAGFDINSCTQFGTTMSSTWIYWLPLLYAAGSSIANDAGDTLLINSEPALTALQNIADLSKVKQCAPSVGVTDSVFSDTSAMLMNNQLGMFVGGTFLLGNFTKENYDVGIAQIPTMNGAPASNMVWSAAYSMSAKSKHPEEAALFLNYMADFNHSVDAVLENDKLSLGSLPCTKDTLDEASKEYENWTKAYSPAMAEVTSGILANASRVGENVTLKNFSVIMYERLVPALDEVWLGSKTAKEAISALEEQLKSDLQGTW